MRPSHKKILDVLRRTPASSKELTMITGLSPDGIRGRISEIRVQYNYDIKKIDGKYHLCDDDLDIEKVISYVASHNLYDLRIKVSTLQDKLDMSHEDITNVLSELYHRNQLLQLEKDVVIIYHL